MTKRKLPPDPENANKLRAQWAKLALRRFAEETHQSLTQEMPDIVCDLLVDLAHFCDRRKLDMLHELRRAKGHYFEETDRQGKQLTELPDAPAEQPDNGITDEQYRAAAKDQYDRDGEVEIDDNAKISRGDAPGAYVEAWVWVGNAEVPYICQNCGREWDRDDLPNECECGDKIEVCPNDN